MKENIKIMLGAAAQNFTDEQIELFAAQALSEVEAYCNREADAELKNIAERLTIVRLNRINAEGLSSQSYSGNSESYIDGYPADILAAVNMKRKIKVVK